MRIIKIEADTSGAHSCQTIESLTFLPKGWAIVPKDMELPNLPYGDLTVEKKFGVPTVTSWTPGEIPSDTPVEPVLNEQDDIDTMLIDHEYRLTLLELEV